MSTSLISTDTTSLPLSLAVAASSAQEPKSPAVNTVIRTIVDRALPQAVAPFCSDGAQNVRDFVNNIGVVLRSDLDMSTAALNLTKEGVCPEVIDQLFASQAHFGHRIGSGYPASGILQIGNIFSGAMGVYSDRREIAIAKAVGDTKGVFIKRISLVQNTAAIGFGSTFGPFRALAIASNAKGVVTSSFEAPTLLGRVTYGFSFLGMIFITLLNALGAVLSGVKAGEGFLLKRKLEKGVGLDAKIQAVAARSMGGLSKEKILAKIEKEHPGRSKEVLEKEALKSGLHGLKALCKEVDMEPQSEEVLRAFIEKNFDLEIVGLALKLNQAEVKRNTKLSRVLSAEGRVALEKLQILVEKNKGKIEGTPDEKEAKKLLETVMDAMGAKIKSNLKSMCISLILGIASIGGMIVSGGVGLLVVTFISLIASIVNFVQSGLNLYDSWKTARLHPNDKLFLGANTALLAASFAAILGLTLSGVASMGIVPLVVISTLFAFWLVQAGATYYVMQRNEKKYQLEHPTLESFIAFLKTSPTNTMAKEVMERLPEALKRHFEKEVNVQNWTSIAEILERRIALAKEEEKEIIRNFLKASFQKALS